MANIGIDLIDLNKEIRGVVYQVVNKELEGFNVKKYVEKYVSDYLKKTAKLLVKQQVYKYMEESEIVLPTEEFKYGREHKIALNTFIIQIVKEVMTNRITKMVDKMVKIEIIGE